MNEKNINSDLVIPVFDWQRDRLLDGAFHQAFDYFVYLIDQECAVTVAFFLFRATPEDKMKTTVEDFFLIHYGEYEKYAKYITYLNIGDIIQITTKLFLFVHIKFLTDTFKQLVERGIDIQQQILGNAEVIVSKRYDENKFNSLLHDHKYLLQYNNKLTLLLPKYETTYNNDIFNDTIYHDFGINYKNYHTFGTPDNETHMININYQKYTTVLRETIDNLINKYNVLWFANLDDERLKTIAHYHLLNDTKVYDMFNHYTHYHYLEPRWQTSNCRMIAETLYLGKELIFNRPVDIKDEAWYKYNMCTHDKFYFDINDCEVIKILERIG